MLEAVKNCVKMPSGEVVNYAELVKRAEAAGMAALEAKTPRPMVVGSPLGGMFANKGLDPKQPQYFEPEGACGFAWVWFAGNTPFGRWMKKNKKVMSGYPTGLQVWVSEGGQSVERKEAYADAYAKVLKEAGIEAFSQSRLD